MSKSALLQLTLTQAKEGLEKRDFTSREITTAFLENIHANAHLNAYINLTEEKALAQADQADMRLKNKTNRLLEGLPLGIKDIFCTEGDKTTAGSHMLENFVSPYESTVTQNLKDDGAVFLGKTNMDEFAMGSANITSYFGAVINPWRERLRPEKDLTPGGSSGGSAAAVAGRLALAATASDTGGSIRQPAAFCGLVGMKPTYGLCSRRGMVAFASSLDQAGPLTHTVADNALMLESMASFDPWDATSLPRVEKHRYHTNLIPQMKGLRIGLPKEYMENLTPAMAKLMDETIAWAKAEGAHLQEVLLPTTPYALPTYYVIAPAEASSNLARYDGVRYGLRVPGESLDKLYENTRHDGFGAEVKRRIMIGTYVLSAGYYDAYYLKAQKVRSLITQDFERVFQEVDMLLTPTTPSSAFALDEKPSDPITMYQQDIYTVTVNLAGLPGISLPGGLDEKGLPLGIQLIGPRLSEQTLFNSALVLEKCADFAGKVKELRKVA